MIVKLCLNGPYSKTLQYMLFSKVLPAAMYLGRLRDKTPVVHASCCFINNDGFHFKHKSRSFGQCFLFFPVSCHYLHASYAFVFSFITYRFFLFHVSVPLDFSVAYNISMYIICPWWRKKKNIKKKQRNRRKKKWIKNNILSCFSVWVWKSTSIFVCGWILKKKKRKKKKNKQMVCFVEVCG